MHEIWRYDQKKDRKCVCVWEGVTQTLTKQENVMKHLIFIQNLIDSCVVCTYNEMEAMTDGLFLETTGSLIRYALGLLFFFLFFFCS